MIVSMAELLQDARARQYAVAMPIAWNHESTQAVIRAAEEMRSPVIMGAGYKPGIELWMEYARPWCERAGVPIAINQDHGRTFASAVHCIRMGFSSIMIDRSTLPFEENIAQVKEITAIAHAVGVSVEAELGHVANAETYETVLAHPDKDAQSSDPDAALTDPQQAAEFVRRTGIDALAVAIGTAHGHYIGTPHSDFDRLAQLRAAVDVPLVLHGGSGTGDENLARAAQNGICKVNLYTDLVTAYVDAVRTSGILEKTYHAAQVEAVGYEAFTQELMRYMRIFGSAGRA